MDLEFSESEILNISLSNQGFIIFLQRVDNPGEKVLPICVGAAEVNSISAALAEQVFPRPLTHTLFKNILTELNANLSKIQITELKEGTFYAKLFVDFAGETKEFDSRPSDAIGLALRYKVPILVNNYLFEEAGVVLEDPENEGEPEKKLTPVEALKQALDKAVEEERFEDASKLKAKIQQLEMDDLLGN